MKRNIVSHKALLYKSCPSRQPKSVSRSKYENMYGTVCTHTTDCIPSSYVLISHPIPSHPIPSHRIASHRIASHRIPSHLTTPHDITRHYITLHHVSPLTYASDGFLFPQHFIVRYSLQDGEEVPSIVIDKRHGDVHCHVINI